MKIEKILNKIKQSWMEKKYINYIDNHRINIDLAFEEMVMCPDTQWMDWSEDFCVELKERIDVHDDSKYEDEEFEAYRKNFYPINDEEKEDNKEAFDKAWEHHWKNNRHHWEARQNDPEEIMTKRIILDCIENVLDWMAMGYKFGDRPYQYYEKVKDEIKLPKCQRNFIEKLIYEGVDKKYIK